MIALDTNILVRLFVAPADEAERAQQATAAALLDSAQQFLVPVTVTLEFAWVLNFIYRIEATSIRLALDRLLALPNITVEDAGAVEHAAEWHVKGLDFADALHLAKSAGCAELATFDAKRFARRAARLGLKPPCRVPGT